MIMDFKTGYDWCLESNMRVLDLHPEEEATYYTEEVIKEAFLEWLVGKTVKPNSTPRKTEMYLEYRMYGIVPYNISPIQAGIQYGHGVVEYQQNTRGMGKIEDIYNKWATQDKTFIICNGGTTNENKDGKWYGTMQQKRDQLTEAGILFSEFREPDLNDSLTAVVFLADERVFNDELYPNYVDMPYPWKDKGRGYKPSDKEMGKWESENAKNREKWVEKIGGTKNDFLRTFASKYNLRLANN
jgi:hypothetical protein